MSNHDVDLLLLGAGPCGIGAATRIEALHAAGEADPSYLLIDGRDSLGGMASSVTTDEGFLFDLGSHVLFPHARYPDFVQLLGSLQIEWQYSLPDRKSTRL